MKKFITNLRILYYYAMFKTMKDCSINHISDKETCEYTEYLWVVYEHKLKEALKKRATKFFNN